MNFSKQNVLIVEDDIETLEIMTEVFEPIFSKVYQAKDGYEAIENIQKNKIDVILCDINIPKLKGLDVVNNIRKANNDVVIIMVSAYSDSERLGIMPTNSTSITRIITLAVNDKVRTHAGNSGIVANSSAFFSVTRLA